MARRRTDDREERKETFREWSLLLLRDLAIMGLIFAIVLGGLFAYSQVWPPIVVVESSSMQHSDTESFIGVIDTGDYVLVQAAPLRGEVTTWVEGRAQSYRTYGDYGDVIIFWPPVAADTPIIHRAILWLEWNATGDGWDAPSLLALPTSEWIALDRNRTPLQYPFAINGSITIRHMGFRGDLTEVIRLSTASPSRRVSGYITMGDNNAYKSGPDPWIVVQGNVVGHARGELPWFGLLKLTIAPADFCCHGWGDPSAPRSSWDALTVSLILLVAGPFAADFGISLWRKRHKAGKGHSAAVDAGRQRPAGEISTEDRAQPPEEPSH